MRKKTLFKSLTTTIPLNDYQKSQAVLSHIHFFAKIWVAERTYWRAALLSVKNHFKPKVNEPPRVKTNKMAYATGEDSDQPGHPHSLIWSEFAVRMKKAWSLHVVTDWAHSEDSDQTGRMPRLIWVSSGRKDDFVGFFMRRLETFYDWCYLLLRCM